MVKTMDEYASFLLAATATTAAKKVLACVRV
jgi:hypothetical protein